MAEVVQVFYFLRLAIIYQQHLRPFLVAWFAEVNLNYCVCLGKGRLGLEAYIFLPLNVFTIHPKVLPGIFPLSYTQQAEKERVI